ncbi:hypothetical protein BP5796_02183 [Coleophoma crateriformis]|uniref:Nephrocystin 3-like N-terminal domain-containing protein n=1 Tax=Coleophoma crateriformis TaxID=565419 RepID=A0A3D8SZ22_9HELO|nr:hypothetical protein BP5796_02183 [Coleophoma crateriformis]
MGTSDSCWEAIGEAREAFLLIAAEIKDHLDKNSDPVSQAVTWSIYMIGRTRETATPRLMFCCQDSKSRKSVRKTVEESGILDRYPGVKVGDSSRPPDFDQLVPLASNPAGIPDSHAGHVRDKVVYYVPSRNAFGAQLFWKDNSSEVSAWRKATGGGLVRLGDRLFYLTVEHIFTDFIKTFSHDPVDDEFEFDIGQDDVHEETTDLSETTSKGSITPETVEYASSDDTGPPYEVLTNPASQSIYNRHVKSSELASEPINTIFNTLPTSKVIPQYTLGTLEVLGNVVLLASEGCRPGLDYALVQVNSPELHTNNLLQLASNMEGLYPERVGRMQPRNTDVICATGSAEAALEGVLSGTPTFMKLPSSNTIQEVWTVKLNGILAIGDCGSWVIDIESGDLLGHIAYGSPITGVAYIIPAYKIFEDIKERKGEELALPTRNDLHINIPLEILPLNVSNEHVSGVEGAASTGKGKDKIVNYEAAAASLPALLLGDENRTEVNSEYSSGNLSLISDSSFPDPSASPSLRKPVHRSDPNILGSSSDPDILLSAPVTALSSKINAPIPTTFYYLPLPKNHNFVGRSAELDELKQKLLLRKECGDVTSAKRQAAGSGPSSSKPRAKAKSIRISRIPNTVSRDQLRDWLDGLPVSSKQPVTGNLLQLSIAANHESYLQATATFKEFPAQFCDVEKDDQHVDGPEGSKILVDSHFKGTTVLYESENSESIKADIVAVHGLGGHALGSWKSPTSHNVWLRDFLPEDVEDVRVMTYGYDTDLKVGKWKNTIYDLANSMLNAVHSVRKFVSRTRPIIFMGHSLGGLLIKQALIIVADNQDYKPYQDILHNCCGVVFFGVPNQGIRYNELISMVEGERSLDFVRGLLPDEDTEESPTLRALSRDFGNRLKKFRYSSENTVNVLCYYETQQTCVSKNDEPKVERLLVTESSATYTGDHYKSYNLLRLEGDHRSMVKLKTQGDAGYISITGKIQEFIEDAMKSHVDPVSTISKEPTTEDLPCLHSLAFPEMKYRKQDLGQAYANTCQWILEHDSYMKWIATDHGLLWIKGKPGSGKSTLMSFVHKDFVKRFPVDKHLTLDFFFHGRGVELQKTPAGLFRSLLHQLYIQEPAVRPMIRQEFKENNYIGEVGKGWQWPPKDLKELFSRAVQYAAKSQQVSILVDALDEAGSETASQLADYFHQLDESSRNINGSMRICIACRHYPILSTPSKFEIIVEKNNSKDILAYVQSKIRSRIPTLQNHLEARLWDDLIRDIVTEAKGVFQWVYLIIPLIINHHSEGESLVFIRKELKKLPETLDEVYEHILQNVIPVEKLSRTLHLMQWVCLMERPLSVTELRYALGSDVYPRPIPLSYERSEDFVDDDVRMKRLINSLSGGLVEVIYHDKMSTFGEYEEFEERGQSQIVQVIHQSVNDYYRSKGLSYLLSKLDSAREDTVISSKDAFFRSQDRLCRSCINYLSLGEEVGIETWKVESLVGCFPFIDYATANWYVHAEKTGGRTVLENDLVERFESQHPGRLQSWVTVSRMLYRYYSHDRLPAWNTTLLHVASSSNLQITVQRLIAKGTDVEQMDDDGNSAMYYAARFGHTKIIESLSDAGAQLEVQNKNYSTPLKAAVTNGHEIAMELLLSRGANVNKGSSISGSALYDAAHNGHTKLVKKLIEKGAEVNTQGGQYGNALQAAASNGHQTIVELLLEKGAEVNAQGGEYSNALQAAARRGHQTVVELLLEKGAEVNAQGGEYGNALQAAAWSGYQTVVELLLEKGAEVNAQGGEYGNTLQAAASNGRQTIVELLLEKGAEVNAQGGDYGNALQAAAWSGHQTVVELLLEKGAEVNAQGGEYGNALQAAASNGHQTVVELLLEKGAEVNAQALNGHQTVVELLLENGAYS